MNEINITPVSQAPAAGLWRRLAAALYDALLLLAVLFIATTVVFLVTGPQAIAPGAHWYQAYLLLAGFLFFGWFWTHGGQTLGMRSWRLRVQQPDGAAITWAQALLRFAGAAISWGALGLGYLWILIDREHLAWHDRLSGTRVVVLPPRR